MRTLASKIGTAAVCASLLFTPISAVGMRLLERDKASRAPAQKKTANPSPNKDDLDIESSTPAKGPKSTPIKDAGAPGPFTIQVGTYQSIRRAQILRSTLENIGPSRIDEIEGDQGQPMYRVVVGKFPTSKDAKEFSDRHHFPKLFPRVWVHPVADEKGYVVQTSEANSKLLDDPYLVNVNLACQDGRTRGTHLTTLRPEPELKGSEVQLAVNWNCYLDSPENWKKREDMIRPSHVFITPQMTFGTMKGALDTTRTDFNYGAEIGMFRNFGVAGTGLAYRILNRRLSQGTSLDYWIDHRFRTWISIHLRERFAIVPEFEYRRRPMLLENAAGTAAEYDLRWLSGFGVRGDLELVQIGERGRLILSPGFQLLGALTADDLTVTNGTAWSVTLRTRSFFADRVAGDWYVTYGSLRQPTSRGNQEETMLTFGFSVLWTD